MPRDTLGIVEPTANTREFSRKMLGSFTQHRRLAPDESCKICDLVGGTNIADLKHEYLRF